MKRKLYALGACCLLLLPACSNAGAEKGTSNKSVPSEKAVTNAELKGQELSDIKKLATPDRLVYLHDGVKVIYKKDDPKFKKIMQLNTARQTKELGALKLFVDSEKVAKQGDYLIYEYTSANYAPIYFSLVLSPDEKLDNWAVNVADSGKSSSIDQTPYGHLAPADELLTYLKRS